MNNSQPSKLFKLKNWLTLTETAHHLSVICGEYITEADIYRLALDGNLKLSVDLVNHAMGRCGELVGIDGIKLGKFPAKWTIDFDYLPDEAKGKPLPYIKSLHVRGEQFLNLGDKVTVIQGVWDLPMIGGERIDIEAKYHELTGGPSVGLINLEGVFLERAGVMCQIQDRFDDIYGYATARRTQFDKLRRLELTTTNNRRKENLLALRREKLKKLTEIEDKWIMKGRYYPAATLPVDCVLVVRTDALREFEQLISDIEPKCNATIPTDAKLKEEVKKSDAHEERHAKKREQILGAALSVLAKWPDECRSDKGKPLASKIAQMVESKAELFWPDGQPPLKLETIEEHIRDWIKKTGGRK